MAFKKLVRVARMTIVENGDTAGQIHLAQIPQTEGGRVIKVDSLNLHLTYTVNKSGTISFGAGAASRLVSRVALTIPGVGQIRNLEGLALARLFRAENQGRRAPGTGSASGTNTIAVDMTLPIQFLRPGAKRPRDFSLPAALLADAELKINWGVVTDVLSASTLTAATMEVIAVCSAVDRVEVPSIVEVSSNNYGAGTTEPPIPRGPSRYLTLIAARQAAVWSSTEWPVVGARYGSQVQSDDSLDPSNMYMDFNSSAVTELVDHTSGSPAIDDSLPLVYASAGQDGDRQTDAPTAAQPTRLYTSVAAEAYTLISSKVFEDSPALRGAVERKLGIPPSASVAPVSADDSPVTSARTASTLPKRQVR